MFIVCAGECMLELTGGLGELSRLTFGGDTFNTAVYLARLGFSPVFLTALGDDPYSQDLLAAWRAEGVGTELVLRCAGRLPGLYAIRTESDGERRFFYWRNASAACSLFSAPGCEAALTAAAGADLLFLSGITLSLYPQAERLRLCDLAARVRSRGGQVAFDPNYRPHGWRSLSEAHAAIRELAPFVTTVLPTLQDESLLWGDASAEETATRWSAWGAEEIVVKLGAGGAWVRSAQTQAHVPAVASVRALDTTGAGDAFNAGYLAMRARGRREVDAVRLAHTLAAAVVQHRGAIVPREATAEICAGAQAAPSAAAGSPSIS
jgi:2-dehydro-3-deoxygluconokinase